jgi:ribosome-associated protein
MLTSAQVAENIVKALDDKKGQDIKLLKTDGLTVLADYFVICSATSAPHIKALSDEVDKRLSELGEPPLRREGYRSGSWVLLDFGCVILHLFQTEAREFYNLERLWNDAENIDIAQIIAE